MNFCRRNSCCNFLLFCFHMYWLMYSGNHLHILLSSPPSYTICIIFCRFLLRFCIRYGFWSCLDYCRYIIHTLLQKHVSSVCDNMSNNNFMKLYFRWNWNFVISILCKVTFFVVYLYIVVFMLPFYFVAISWYVGNVNSVSSKFVQ